MSRALEDRPKSSRRYSSLSAFYRSDQRRIESKESDVGLWWREAADGPLHRAAWVRDTGELYLARLGPSEDGGGEVEVLAVVTDREHLDDALEGWRDECGKPNSVSWLRERATRLGRAARAAQLRMTSAASTVALAVALSIEFS
jgi:hypothetical protein